MIIIKDVPGLTDREILEVLTDITHSSIMTGHGGFVVDEDIAEQFLTAYLVVTGKRPAKPAVPTAKVETITPIEPPPAVPTAKVETITPPPAIPTAKVETITPITPPPAVPTARTTTRRTGRRKEG